MRTLQRKGDQKKQLQRGMDWATDVVCVRVSVCACVWMCVCLVPACCPLPRAVGFDIVVVLDAVLVLVLSALRPDLLLLVSSRPSSSWSAGWGWRPLYRRGCGDFEYELDRSAMHCMDTVLILQVPNRST